MTLHSNHLQISVERGLADAVKNSINAVPTRDLLDLCHKILRLGVDGVVSAILAHELELLVRAGCADDLGADGAQHLHEQETDAARRGVHERPLAGLDLRGLAHKGPRGETLEIHGSGLLRRQRIGNGHGDRRRDGRVLGVGAVTRARHVDDFGARLGVGETGHGRMRRDDLAGGFTAECQREGRRWVETRAEVGVDEVDASKVVAHEDLALLGLGDGDVLVVEDLDAAGLGDGDGLHGVGDGRHGCECAR